MRLQNIRMHNGSRHFATLRGNASPERLAAHLATLPGLEVTKTLFSPFVTDDCWVDFTFRSFSFSLNFPFGDVWLFSENPDCADDILIEIAGHAVELLALDRSMMD